MIATQSIAIQRSWPRTLAWTLGMLILLGLAGLMGYWGEYLVAGVLALVGLLSIVGIGSGSYTTHCPVCDKELRGLIGLTRCPQCLCYGKVSEGEYSELQPDSVIEVPLLALPLGNRREMPPLCCACGAPAALRVIPDPWCRADCHRG